MTNETVPLPTLETLELINALFNKFFALFPASFNLFESQKDLDSARRIWCISFWKVGLLDENGILNKELISVGNKRLLFLNQEYMPSFGQYMKLCGLDENKEDSSDK
jgi:hypothetical protein